MSQRQKFWCIFFKPLSKMTFAESADKSVYLCARALINSIPSLYSCVLRLQYITYVSLRNIQCHFQFFQLPNQRAKIIKLLCNHCGRRSSVTSPSQSGPTALFIPNALSPFYPPSVSAMLFEAFRSRRDDCALKIQPRVKHY